MWTYLNFLLVASATQAFVAKEVEEIKKYPPIPRTTFTRLNLLEVPVLSLTIQWKPVPSTSVLRIAGYKVIVREEIQPNTNQYKRAKEIVIFGGNKSMATVTAIRRNVWYEFRVQAFTWNNYGPLSSRWAFRVLPQSERKRRMAYTLEDRGD